MPRIHAFHLLFIVIATVLMAPFNPSRCQATTSDWARDFPRWWDVPQPHLEDGTFFNLYWHDPTLGWREHCRYFSPDALGCAPRWYAKAEAMFLKRDSTDDFVFATLGEGGARVLSTSTFDDEFETQSRITLGLSLGDWYRVEASYFGAPAWSSQVSVNNSDTNSLGEAGNLFSPFTNFGVPTPNNSLDYNNLAAVQFSSKLQGGGLNVRRRILMRPGYYESSATFGLRIMEIDERFQYLTQSVSPFASQNALSISTDNELIGTELGWTAQFFVRPRLWIDADVRGGVYHNNASQSTLYQFTNAAGGGAPYITSASRSRTTYIGEILLQLNCSFSSSLTAYGGYYAMGASGLALAANNLETDVGTLVLGPGRLNHSGEVVYHGPFFGMVYAR